MEVVERAREDDGRKRKKAKSKVIERLLGESDERTACEKPPGEDENFE